MQGEIVLSITFYFKTKRRRDLDNQNKILFDALSGIVYDDDSQIAELRLRREYDRARPRIEIEVQEVRRMSARSLAALWHDIMQNGDAFLDNEGQVQGWTLDGLVAVNDVRRRPVFRYEGIPWVVDNSMRAFGEVDPNRLLVRIHVAKHKRKGESLIDTLVHEELHILFPRFGEARICAMTEQKLRRMSAREKKRLYRKVSRSGATL